MCMANPRQEFHHQDTENVIQTNNNMDHQQAASPQDSEQPTETDCPKRSQLEWGRASLLGANVGLVLNASLMLGIGVVKRDKRSMILTGFAGLVAGACSMATREFPSVYSRLHTKVVPMNPGDGGDNGEGDNNNGYLLNTILKAAASSFAFAIGAMVPLLAALCITEFRVRVIVVITFVTVSLLVFGWIGATLGKSPMVNSTFRVLFRGYLAIGITCGLTKLIDTR